jgi:manganese transport protein
MPLASDSTVTGGRWSQLAASLLPGIFLIGYNVGTGSITAMSKAGAVFGTELLWAVLLSCVMTYYLMSLCSRFTIVTSMTLIEGMRRHIHPALAVFFLVVLSAIILSALIGVLGIIADVLQVWSATLVEGGIARNWCALFTAALVLVLVVTGDSRRFEKLLALLVAIMAIAFITTMIMEFPGWGTVLGGLVPSMPDSAPGSDTGPLVVVAGVVGTTVSVFVLVIRTGLVQEKGWGLQDLAVERRDARVSASLMFIVSAAVMITAAATLHQQGVQLNRISEMIPMLEPVFGPFALTAFVFGVVAAGLSSHLPNLLVIPWIIDDYRGVTRETRSRPKLVLLLGLTLFSLAGVSLGGSPVFLMLVSQASIAVVLPVLLCAVVYLTCSRRVMGEHRNSVADYLILAGIMAFALYMSAQGVQGLLADLGRM